MQTEETNERYLEKILFLQETHGDVHAIDICKAMGYSKPTVSIKLKLLHAEGYIVVDEKEHISLTKKGLDIALKISERHHLLSQIFVKIGISPQIAEEDACKIEHDLSDETFEQIKKYFNKKF